MSTLGRAAATAAVLTLAACAVHYVKPGATQEDWANDHQFCELYAQRLSKDDTTWASSWTRERLVRECLEERGWRRQ